MFRTARLSVVAAALFAVPAIPQAYAEQSAKSAILSACGAGAEFSKDSRGGTETWQVGIFDLSRDRLSVRTSYEWIARGYREGEGGRQYGFAELSVPLTGITGVRPSSVVEHGIVMAVEPGSMTANEVRYAQRRANFMPEETSRFAPADVGTGNRYFVLHCRERDATIAAWRSLLSLPE